MKDEDIHSLFKDIRLDIERLYRIKQSIISGLVLVYGEKDSLSNLRHTPEDIFPRIEHYQKTAYNNLKLICDRIKIINLYQQNTFITSDDDILLLEMIYTEIFDDLIFLTKEKNNSLDIRYTDVKKMLRSRIGKARFKRIIKKNQWWV